MAKLGRINLDDENAVHAEIVETFTFNYDIGEKQNDIALMRLKEPLKIERNILPACLYTKDDDPTGLVITGWGLTGNNSKQLTTNSTVIAIHIVRR